MKYIKTFEDINKVDKRKGIYVSTENILFVINQLKERDIKFMLLFGSDDNADDECFLILIEGDDYTKLKSVDEMGYKDYYIDINFEKGKSNDVFLNWFEPENIEGDWQVIRNTNRENIEAFINSKKFNI
jgi:hypothetical protein